MNRKVKVNAPAGPNENAKKKLERTEVLDGSKIDKTTNI